MSQKLLGDPRTTPQVAQAAGAPALRGAAATQDPDSLWRALRERASARYRAAGRFTWHFARGKLRMDPVFRSMLERGDLSGRQRVLDLGCGQALLASLMQACTEAEGEGRWPAAWPRAPRPTRYTGIELMPRDVARAQPALSALGFDARVVCADMQQVELPACDVVVILDVLHYIGYEAQADLLARIRTALTPHGRLLLRVADTDDVRSFAITRWVDRIVTAVRGHRVPPTWCRSVTQWKELLQGLGFTVEALPMHRGTPFANVLLVADRVDGSAAGSA